MTVRPVWVVLLAGALGASGCLRSGSTGERRIVNGTIAAVGAAAVTYAVLRDDPGPSCRGTDDPGCSDEYASDALHFLLFGVLGGAMLVGGTVGLVSNERDAQRAEEAAPSGSEDPRAEMSSACAQWRSAYAAAESAAARDRLLASRPTHCRRLRAR